MTVPPPGRPAGSGEGRPVQQDLFGSPSISSPALRPTVAPEAHPPSAPPPQPPANATPPAGIAARPVVLSVGELTRQIKTTLEGGYGRVWVRGEISGFRGPNPRGHLYFSLKDEDACLDAKIWSSTAARIRFRLKDGLAVVAEGSIDLYEPQGRYSLVISRLEPVGEGALALAFEQLKEKLAAQGLWGPKRQRPLRPLPFLPKRIGVVTSRTGAALQDFLRILYRRHPRLSVLLCDARVQGDGAAAEIASAIHRLSRTDVDVVVVTRGGGSIEDLWAFNEESVARAIFACPVPVVSAVGHEVDFTIADFVADHRAPTPSAAAELLAPVLSDLELSIAALGQRLRKAVERDVLHHRRALSAAASQLADPRRLLGQKRLHIAALAERAHRSVGLLERALRERLKALRGRLDRQRPESRVAAQRQGLTARFDALKAAAFALLRGRRSALSALRIGLVRHSPKAEVERIRGELNQRLSRLAKAEKSHRADRQRHFQNLAARLDAMSPLKVMARGYSVAFRQSDGHLIRSGSDAKVGDAIALKLNGAGCSSLSDCDEIDATVTQVRSRTS